MYLSIPHAISTLVTLILGIPPQTPLSPARHDEITKQAALHPLSCGIRRPSSYQQIAQDEPTTSFPQINIFNVSQGQGGTSNVDTLVVFPNMSSHPYPCVIGVSFISKNPISSSGSTELNVYSLDSPISPTDTYETYFPDGNSYGRRYRPKDGHLLATTTITEDELSVVVSMDDCLPGLEYLFQIAGAGKEGAVMFADADGKDDKFPWFDGLHFTCP